LENIGGDVRIEASLGTEFFDEKGIREEPHVEHDIRVNRHPILVAKGLQCHQECVLRTEMVEGLSKLLAQFMNGKGRRVDNLRGELAESGE